ncbi:ATP-binding protein [Amycolatopsis sp.]|uniref:ATP-binding protein n=1 Tax=Amycolatopsis sp. TaxID=37632 RepID=UPI002D810484|nr:ATP-binding protein [Amycolatopsis sp.]HET6710901.1 ATP-binding protein [Amycolatopsis sp.]
MRSPANATETPRIRARCWAEPELEQPTPLPRVARGDRELIGRSPTVTTTACKQVTVLRAAQETLSNVGRHARAQRVDVTLSYMEDVIVLDVCDDGTGFTPGQTSGFGLTALQERVRALAGGVDIECAPGGGTAVSVTVPVIGVDR